MQTIFQALELAGWDRKTGTVVIQHHRWGERDPDVEVFTVDTPKLDIPLGYDYVRRENISVIAKDENYLYIQCNDDDATDFMQIALDIGLEYRAATIPVFGTEEWERLL